MAAEHPEQSASWAERKLDERGRRALERQLDYQEEKAAVLASGEDELVRINFVRSQMIRKKIETIAPLNETHKILEVGSGAHGLVFGIATGFGIGVDPLAVSYKRLFPKVQHNARTIAAIGEELPFADASFDVVLSDNVIDHAARPFGVLDEIVRVLRPGGTLYFTVNVHHPFYELASRFHGLWNALGIRYELSAFADHTVHLTEQRISQQFATLPVNRIEESSNISSIKIAQRKANAWNADAILKKIFFKNAVYELLATKN